MDEKLKAIEKELEQTRSALRWQTKRCHHLVSALSVKLDQRDAEVKATQNMREAQLSQILRALLVLEARLRREQRSIRAQLGSRDALIKEQQLEIVRLKKLTEPQRPISPPESFQNEVNEYECRVKPDLISSLGIWQHLHNKNDPHSLLQSSNQSLKTPEHSPQNIIVGSVVPLSQDRAEKITSPTTKVSNAPTHERNTAPVPKSPIDEEDGLKIVNQIVQNVSDVSERISKGHDLPEKSIISDRSNRKDEKLEKTVTISDIIQVRTHPDDISVPESADSFTIIHDISKLPENCSGNGQCVEINLKPLPPSALLHEMQVQSKSSKNEYHDNPVLECVNQILLRDQEEFLEEQRVLRMREVDRNRNENLNIRKSLSRDDLTRTHNHNVKEKSITPSKKINNNFQDNSPCLMAAPQLSLVGNLNFEEGLSSDILNHELKSNQIHMSVKLSPHGRGLIPPALPPKPLRLLSIKSSADFTVDGVKVKQSPPQPQSQLQIQPPKFELDIRSIESNHPLIIGKSSPALPDPNSDSELYVISNSALDDDIVQQLQGRNIRNCTELKKALHPEQKRLDITHASIHFPSGKKKELTNHESITSPKSAGNTPEKRKNTPVKNSPSKPVIKVASPVSSLLATVESITEKSGKKEASQSVSQIVRRFEHLGSNEKLQTNINPEDDGNNALRKNFEEFRLDECDMDVLCVSNDSDGRPEADGAENRLNGTINTTTAATTVTPSEAGVSYENFLEATGLSQKSIMTPSRIFSNNHRNVLKPKDVKHRSRVKAAATVANPTVRYWTEPFL